MADVVKLKKALECVSTRLRLLSRDRMTEPQRRWIDKTLAIAQAALREG